jgi:hypothetical protein
MILTGKGNEATDDKLARREETTRPQVIGGKGGPLHQ